MDVTITPSSLQGTVNANPSKSHAQRAIAMAGLAHGTSVLYEMSRSDDALAALDVIRAFAVSVETVAGKTTIVGNGKLSEVEWNCRESGFSLRMFTALAGLFNREITLTGHGSLRQRPVGFVEAAMTSLGVHCKSNGGMLPLTVKGPLLAGEYVLDGSVSSQLISGVLMAMPLLDQDSTISVDNLKSRPYVDLTISTMQQFGVTVQRLPRDVFHIPGGQHYKSSVVTIEGDWSGAAFLLVAGALGGGVTIHNLDNHSRQSDKGILDALAASGSTVAATDQSIHCETRPSRPFVFDATHAPDLFPPLVSLAAGIPGTSRIAGVGRLQHKESNRYETLRTEYAKLGVLIEKEGNEMLVHGGLLNGGEVFAHNDHRIAMSLAIAGLQAESPVTITGAECVNKSYPHVFEDLVKLGAGIAVKDY